MKNDEQNAIRERLKSGDVRAEDLRVVLDALADAEERLKLRTGIQTVATVRFEVETAEEQGEVLRRLRIAVAEMQLDDDPDIDVHGVEVGIYNVRRQVPFHWLNPQGKEGDS